MSTPSVKMIQKVFPNLPMMVAKNIRETMLHAAPDQGVEEALEALSDMLGGYGYETIKGPFRRGYWAETLLAYVNTGDTYSATIGYEPARDRWGEGRFLILPGGWGSWVEWYEQKHGPIE